MMNKGKIVQVSGPVIDVEFESGRLPRIREALLVTVGTERRTKTVYQCAVNIA